MESRQYKVLLVEDESIYRRAFIRFVGEQQLPYDCMEATCVAEAQDLLLNN